MMDYNIEVKKAHDAGLSLNQIAARYTITTDQVSEILAGNNPIPPVGKKKEDAVVDLK
jgi:hypothetical protein